MKKTINIIGIIIIIHNYCYCQEETKGVKVEMAAFSYSKKMNVSQGNLLPEMKAQSLDIMSIADSLTRPKPLPRLADFSIDKF